jgi:TolA-binding protein
MKKHGYKIAIILLLTVFAGCAYFNTYYNAKRYYKKGYEATRKNRTGEPTSQEKSNYEKAIEKALKVIQFYPKSKYVDDALFLAGKSYYFTQDYMKARRKFLELTVNYPQSPYVDESRLWLGKSQLALKEYVKAEDTFRQLIMENDVSDRVEGEAHYFLGKLYETLKNYEKAVESFEHAVGAGVKDVKIEALYSIAANYDSLGNYGKAAEYFEKLRRAGPVEELLYEAQFRYSQMQKKQGEYDTAISLLERLLGEEKFEKNAPELSLEVAECLYLKEDVDEATLAYQDIIQEHKSTRYSAEASYELGKIFEKDHMNYERAAEHYAQVRKEYSRFALVDSAEILKRDIFRMQALTQVIDMAIRGDEGEAVTIETGETPADTLWREDQPVPPDTTLADTTAPDFPEDIDPDTRDPDDPDDPDNPSRPGDPNRPEEKKPVENPELKTFKKEELDKNLLLLGELYLFRFNLPDSAVSQYSYLVRNFPESPYVPQALYSLAYISREIYGNSADADTNYQILIQRYPGSRFAQDARHILGLTSTFTREDSLKNLFHYAETLLLDVKDHEGALSRYRAIWENNPDSWWAPKALYTMIWIMEQHTDSVETALTLYDTLVALYPETGYAEKVKPRIQFVRGELKRIKQSLTAGPDTTAAPGDSLQDGTGPETTRAARDTLETGDEGKAVPAARDTLEAKGEVTTVPSARDTLEEKAGVTPIRALRDTLEGIRETENEAVTVEASVVGGIPEIVKAVKETGILQRHPYSGVFSVRVEVDTAGQAIHTEILKSTRILELDKAILEVIMEMSFTPGNLDGQAVRSKMDLSIPIGDLE